MQTPVNSMSLGTIMCILWDYRTPRKSHKQRSLDGAHPNPGFSYRTKPPRISLRSILLAQLVLPRDGPIRSFPRKRESRAAVTK
jgi:hypothetical protein